MCSSNENCGLREISDLGCAKASCLRRLAGYTQLT
jgi:hypothetical protein